MYTVRTRVHVKCCRCESDVAVHAQTVHCEGDSNSAVHDLIMTPSEFH